MKISFFLVSIFILLKGHVMASEHTEVLKYFKNNNKWSSSVFLQATTRYSSTVNDNITITNITFIRDNDRCQWKGTAILKANENKIIEEGNRAIYTIMNGKQYLLAVGSDLNTFRRASIKQTDYKETQSLSLDDPDTGSAFWGRIYGNNGMDIYNLIEQSQNVEYRKSDLLIDGLECYEIEGICKFGNIKIIFSPEKGYLPLKWEITKKPGDYFDNKLLSGKHWKVTFQVEEIKNIDGFYIPMKGHMQHDIVTKNGKISSDFYDYELSNIRISPDFEAINAFEFDLPSNVPVALETAPGIKFHFNNGKLTTMIDQDFLKTLDASIDNAKTEIPSISAESARIENSPNPSKSSETDINGGNVYSKTQIDKTKAKNYLSVFTRSILAVCLLAVVLIGYSIHKQRRK